MRSSNPALNHKEFAPKEWGGIAADLRDGPRFGSAVEGAPTRGVSSTTMTMRGTVIKTAILLVLCIGTAVMAGMFMRTLPPGLAMPALIGSAIAWFVLGLVIGFVPRTAPYLAPVYAVVNGVVVGFITLIVASQVKGNGSILVLQAVMLTFGIFIALLAGYAFGFIRIGSTMRKVIVVATLGVCLTYVAHMVLSMMGIGILGAIHGAGWLGIGFSLFVVVLASLNLVLDFQTIETGVANQAPKYMEWYGAFALLVTLVWLYLEILKLLAKLNRRN